MRLLITSASRAGVERITVEVHLDVSDYLSNRKRRELHSLEEDAKVSISIRGRSDVTPNHLLIECSDNSGHVIRIPESSDSHSAR